MPLDKKLCIHVTDSAYFTIPIRQKTLPHHNLISITRIRNNRSVYEKADPSGAKKYGDKMKLNEPDTYKKPDEVIVFETVTTRGRQIKIEIKLWCDRLLRGSRIFKGYENPFNLFQICTYDLITKKKLFKRPMWLAVDGKRRNELSALTVQRSYKKRYDIEHFFRFGKQKLLMNDFQTPDVMHEEKWWQIVQLAYSQLFLSRDECKLLPKDWERCLPKFKNKNDDNFNGIVTPSLAQRYFYKVLNVIGTPAQDVRKVKPGEGRLEGEEQEKRPVEPIIFKKKKKKEKMITDPNEQKLDTDSICGFEKQADVPKPKNKETLIEFLKSWIPEFNISKGELLLLLAKEQAT